MKFNMYIVLVGIHMPGASYRKRFKSLLIGSCDVF